MKNILNYPGKTAADPQNHLKRILVVDDDDLMLEMLMDCLSITGEYETIGSKEALTALELIEREPFNAIITDINLPGLSGLELLKHVTRKDAKIPVILITGYSDPERMRMAIQLGAFDFLRKPFDMSELLIRVKQAIEKNQLMLQNDLYQHHLELVVQQRTMELFATNAKLENHYINTIHAMVNTIEAMDIYTHGHSERVTAVSILLGKYLGLSIEDLKLLRIGALLHDLGKIGVNKPLLEKTAVLSPDEFDLMKLHPSIGARIVDPIGLPAEVHDIILQHHERWDGSGYPNGIKSEEISPLARITAIADAYDAMTSKRPYRDAMTSHSACREIEDNLGKQFDQHIGAMLIKKIAGIQELLKDQVNLRQHIFAAI
ncbi:MAG: response regulator [Candidatus Cloacimonadaceae bacterium]|nr:response regulator [Candidatus Cloacimonadaceae bacterium]MDP3115232.1 response regulator [Candidatus Cloacimonadaceae bacterium]